MRQSVWRVLVVILAVGGGAGCQIHGAAEPFGKTFYLGGASNIDLVTSGVPSGLEQAGYRGDVQTFIWTISFNPLIDQLLTINARARASLLAQEIKRYHQRYPDNEINIIALSAGTGVAIWAVENLDGQASINNLILLGSSLSHDYDVRQALGHIDGKIYVYHSPHDSVLEAVRIVGTIDGKHGVDSAGQVGLKVPPGAEQDIVNTAWARRFLQYGWAGGHTDCTNERFVRHVLGPLIVGPQDRTLEGRRRRAAGRSVAAAY